jgi:Co/Zn/Cd efflux system component
MFFNRNRATLIPLRIYSTLTNHQYICNIYAERLKAGDVEISVRMRFVLEILIPAISLCCLLIVTGYVTNEAIHVLRNPSDDHEKVNIYFLYGFSSANVLVDLLSSYMFFQNGDEDVFLSYRIQKRYNSYNSLQDEVQDGSEHDTKIVSAANLNMISAFTHLTGDSMRTFSVIIAALVSTIAKIPSNICDAYAAIVVTITIAFMVIPLIREIWKAIVKA